MNIIYKISLYNNLLNTFIWDKLGVWLLLSAGIITSISLNFFQITHIRMWWRCTFKSLFEKNKLKSLNDKSSITRFQSVCTSLASTIGVGNLVGVSSAIYIGGPGAVFWMWVAAIFGMMTGYCENVLGIYFRRKNFDGEWSGGPMYYLRDGLSKNAFLHFLSVPLSYAFALFTLLASFGIGSMGQVNKIVINLETAFDIRALSEVTLYENVTLYSLFIGLFLFLLATVITLGGIKRIARFTEKTVPFMLIFFMTGCLWVITKNHENLIPAFKSVFIHAFNFDAPLGAFFGLALRQGIKRGVFSNEAGLGSTVIVHANSDITEPCEQGMWSIFEIFTDTIVVCTMTALVILTSGVYDISNCVSLSGDSTMVADAFNMVLPFFDTGKKLVALTIFLFSFTSVIGWSHYGSKAWEYLFGTGFTYIYKFLHLLSIIGGALLTSSLAWDISDTFNGLMMLPNLVGVICLLGTVIKITRNYIDRKIHGKKILPLVSAFSDIQKNITKTYNK